MPPPEELPQLPPYEMLRQIGEQVTDTHRLVGEQAKSGSDLQQALETFQKFVAQRFLDVNEAIKQVDKRVGLVDGEVSELRGRFDRLYEKVHAEFPDHAERLTELERTRYQRPGSHVSMTDAVQRVNNSIVPGATTKQDLGTQLDNTASFKVQGDVLDKLLAERDAAKIVADSLQAKASSKRLREAVVTAVAIAATLALLSLIVWVLVNAAAAREHAKDQPSMSAPARSGR